MLKAERSNSHAFSTRILKQLQRGRTTGKYQLSTLDLLEVPEELHNGKALEDVNFWEEVPTQSVNLSHNQLQELPPQLALMAGLKVLDVSHNCLSSLPEFSLPELLSLDLSNNAFRALGDISTGFPSLQRLLASKNPLQQLPLAYLPNLIELSVDGCQLKRVPPGIQACQRLTKLSLASNKMTTFLSLEGLTSLVELNLSSNNLSGPVPDTLCGATSLQSLDISQNRLTSLPQGISQMSCLTEVKLSFNQLDSLPDDLGCLKELRVLDFRDNHVTEIPASLYGMSLTYLDARNNRLQSLPAELGRLTTLRFLGVLGNPVKGIRPTLLNAPTSELLSYLHSRIKEEDQPLNGSQEGSNSLEVVDGRLNLAGSPLSSIPPAVWTLGEKLHTLDLRGCRLKEMQLQGLEFLTRLQTLVLAENCLTHWPLSSYGGPKLWLKALDVSCNPLEGIPADALHSCSESLTSLLLTGVQAVGKSDYAFLSGAPKLRDLNLRQCSLAQIPPELLSLGHLTSLTLSANVITEVPVELTSLAALSELDLSDNSIAKLPPELGLMGPTLKLLRVEGNPLRAIRQTVIQSGTPALLQYLRDKLPLR